MDLRLLALNQGLKNNALRLVNSKLLIDSMNDIKKNVDKATLGTQTQSDPNALIDLAILDQKSLETLARERNISNASMPNLDSSSVSVSSDVSAPSAISQPVTAKERAIASALLSAKKRASAEGRVFTKQEEEDVKTNINKQSNLLSGLKLKINNDGTEEKAQAPASPSRSEATTVTIDSDSTLASLRDQIKDLRGVGGIDKYVIKTTKVLIKGLFKKEIEAGNAVYGATGPNERTRKVKNVLEIGDKGFLQFAESKEPQKDIYLYSAFKVNLLENALTAEGLSDDGVVPNYKRLSDQVANFGNLYLSEPPLKKNNLTIYRPKSKLTLISKRNISNTLKKMILDIQSTLEFDESDYSNLVDDEKRIIEKIIRYQQKMKNYNIEKLIDNDDTKIKNRLEILTAQINAGNNSSLIREEMKVLVKSLLKNGAISHGKYYSLVKSIDALAK